MSEEKYLFDSNELVIIDSELDLHIVEKTPRNLQEEVLYYPSGEIKMTRYYAGKDLHGPSLFYAENKVILSQHWYNKGKRQGKSWGYYLHGQLYYIQRFVNNVWHGYQEYYYPDGTLKTSMTYQKGKLEGTVQTFFSNSLLKRELVFKKGKCIKI
jgi:antitoxin component YwqK of YwqJK toxin-antitoxin module